MRRSFLYILTSVVLLFLPLHTRGQVLYDVVYLVSACDAKKVR